MSDLDIAYPCYCGGCPSCLKEQGVAYCIHCGAELRPEEKEAHEADCFENPENPF